MKHLPKWFPIFLLAAVLVLIVTPAGAHDTEPIIIHADQPTALLNPLLMMGEFEGIDDLKEQWGDKQLYAESPEETLIVYASLRRDGALVVLVLNDDAENTHASEIHVEGFKEGGPAVPYHMEPGGLVKQDITVPLFDGKFGYEFAPVSITLFVIPAQRSIVVPLAVGTVAVSGIAAGVLAYRRRRRS